MVIPPPQPPPGGVAGSFGRRLFAWFLDLILIAIFVAFVTFVIDVVAAAVSSGHEVAEPVATTVFVVSAIVTPVVYLVASWRSGATVGMHIMRLRVVPRFGYGRISWAQAWLRLVGSLPSIVVVVPFGLLAVLIRRDRRALHDLLASTRVLYVRDTWVGPGAVHGYGSAYDWGVSPPWSGAGPWPGHAPPAPPPLPPDLPTMGGPS